MLDIFEEIKEIMKEYTGYKVGFDIAVSGLTVRLRHRVEHKWEAERPIPIKYDAFEECIHIPVEELDVPFNTESDIGITYEDIQLIYKIMACLDTHKNRIREMCVWLD